ncbi:MAG: hypothetical protein ABSD49_08865 [Candidatus Bathyarchaeia archaeon]|jgi:hypothetical protein
MNKDRAIGSVMLAASVVGINQRRDLPDSAASSALESDVVGALVC